MLSVKCVRVETVLPDESAVWAAFASLPEWRRRKCDAFRFEADRRRSVAAWALLRRMLAGKGIEAEALDVTENEFGKPAFDPVLGIHFNLSHAGERVMVAVDDRPVGCDVERIVPFDEAVARECLTDEELAMVEGTPPGFDRDRELIRLWVRKESYVKAVGMGLGIDPATFSVLETPPTSGWTWQDFDYGDGYLGCLCVRRYGTDRADEDVFPDAVRASRRV